MCSRMRSWGLIIGSLYLGLLLVTPGCASRRRTTRINRPVDRVFQSVRPEQDYNPPSDPMETPIPQAPPAPRDTVDPPPPSRTTSDTPPVPPRDDFESADRPGRFSASFGPFTGWIRPACQSSDQADETL